MSANRQALEMREVGVCNRVGVRVGTLRQSMAKDAENIIGRSMNQSTSNLAKATESFNQASEHIFAASERLHANMDGLSKKAKDAVSRAKDSAAQMTDAMNKITKLLGADFDGRLKQLQDLTDCLERLSMLQDSGKLEQLMKAIGKP